METKLMHLGYYDPEQEIRLSAYADTIIYESEASQNILRAIRFGGYPEMVRALSDAIYAGAGIDATVQGGTLRLLGQAKRYTRQLTHDGVYAEATLLALDDDQSSAQKQENEAEKNTRKDLKKEPEATQEQPRNCCIFCPKDDKNRLFEELDRKTAVPLIPAFQDYVLEELKQRGILKKLRVLSAQNNLDAWILHCAAADENIVAVVEDGLKNGKIAIPGAVIAPDGFSGVDSVTGYLNVFGVTVAQRIRTQFLPLFDPATEPLSQPLLAINDNIQACAGYSLYDAQLAVAEAVKCQLQKGKCAFIVAECGSGKTKIGAAALAATQAQQGKRKTFNLILCPSHVAHKWAREIGETLPETVGVVVHSITELDRLYALYGQGDKSMYAILSKEKARDGYMKMPAVVWNRRKKAFLCPDCGAVMEMPFSEDGARYMVKADQLWFQKEHRRNHKCETCGTLLWTAVNPGRKSDWVKIGGYGWVYRYRAYEHMDGCKNEAVLEKLREIARDPDGRFPAVGACRRYPLSSYIKRKYSGKIDGCIVDELHEYNNDSGQGDAMGEICHTARKFIGMTATLINGYSSGIFHLLYRAVPQLMQKDGKSYHVPQDFDAEYGVVENTYETEDGNYASNRRKQRRKKRSRQLPGVSPLVYSRFLLEHAAFLSLSDMGKDLPDYEEIPVPLTMPPAVEAEYQRIEKALTNVLRTDKKAAQKILSAYLNLLTVFPDQPYDQPEILHPIAGTPIVSPQNITDFDTLGEKEEKVLELVGRKVNSGGRVLIYTSWIRTDSQQKLLQLLTKNGFRAEIMTEKVSPSAREDWVEKRVQNGLQVLITNPSLMETGLDLNAFTTLIFYSMGYKLFTLRQASRRSWRINQTAPRVEVYLLYYKNTMQHKAMKLMASKLAVAGIIEGNFTEEGLAAMSDVQDMTSQMAKELMLGIRDNVEDIATAFRKMASINPHRGSAEPPKAAVLALPPNAENMPASRMVSVGKCELLCEGLPEQSAEGKKRKPKNRVDENQLTLFASVA